LVKKKNMTARIVVLLVASLAFLSPRTTSQAHRGQTKAKCQLTLEDYAVYAALVDGLGGPEDPEEAWKEKQVFVQDVTGADRDLRSHWGRWGFRSKSKAAPGHDTVVDFERKARSSCALKPQSGDAMRYKLISKEELDKAFNGGDRQGFYKKYPDAGGVWTFSRPGYNSARNEAVLSVSHWCGSLCGTGHLYFLARQNGQWKVRNRLMLWIS
jgi:hypothetical protein